MLRRGVWFRHGSLFCHRASGRVNSSSAAHALCGIGIVPYVATRGRPIIGADIKHIIDIGHFQNRFADNFFLFVFFIIMQTNILFTGDIIYW